jgi:chorismate-pyruvate lyase
MSVVRFTLALFSVCTLTHCQMANRLLQMPLRTLQSIGRIAEADSAIQQRALEVQQRDLPTPEKQHKELPAGPVAMR